MDKNIKKNVFIIGCKGIPGKYGGYETFVDKLTEYHQNSNKLFYHVACKGKRNVCQYYHNARCFSIKVPNIGAAQAIYYDVKAIKESINYIKKHNLDTPIIYILACRIGPFIRHYLKKVHNLGGKIYINPDGHEWKRSKWNRAIKLYWKKSEQLMIKNSDLVICDSKNIEKYILNEYKKYMPRTTYISYGADISEEDLLDGEKSYQDWLCEHGLQRKEYYLIVGRFVPENNYETMIREFMWSNTSKKLVIICNKNLKLKRLLENKLNYTKDDRICFVGTVYDNKLLMNIRRFACGYLHGHEVGGTNPSLLEALGSTDVNMLLDVSFNREVGMDSVLYWNKESKMLAKLIDIVDDMPDDDRERLGKKAKTRIREAYSWENIAAQYEKLFTL